MPHQPFREPLDLLLEQRVRWIAPRIQRVPSTQLHRPQLWMLEGIPGNEAFARQYLVVPLEQLDIVIERIFAIRLDEFVVDDSGLTLRTPDLHGPREHAPMIVH